MPRPNATVISNAFNRAPSSNVSFAKVMENGRKAEEFKAQILALEAKLRPKYVLIGLQLINFEDFAAGKKAQDRTILTSHGIRTVHCRKASPYTMADVARESAKRGVNLVQDKIVEGNLVKYGLVSYTPVDDYVRNNRVITGKNVLKFIPPEVTGEAAVQLGKEIDRMQARKFCGTTTKNVPFAFAKFQFERSNPPELMKLT